MFWAVYPKDAEKMIGMYINLELQQKYYPGYPFEMRGIYYASRILASQLQKIDNDTNYGQLQKVYSIWVCMGDDVPADKAGTATLYQIDKHDIIGSVEVKQEYYDLLTVILIRINDRMESSDETLRMLQTICSRLIGKQEKIAQLKSYGIRVSSEMERRLDYMSGFGYAYYEDGVKAGRKEGILIGRQEGLLEGKIRVI